MRAPAGPTVALSVVLVLLLSGCALGSKDPAASPTPASPTASTSEGPGASGPASPSPTGGSGALPDDLRSRPAVAAAIADTARRQRVDPAEVVIAAWSPVTWTDGSLGCPQKVMSYTQALVEGELLMLRVGTELFQYHARTGGPFAYCPSPSAAYTVGS